MYRKTARVIEARALTKRYGERLAVADLTFTAPAGQVTGFLGPNGAGKTTTFRMLLGLAAATGGQALVDGRTYADLPEPRRVVGAVLESSGFHPGRSGRDHLRTITAAAGLPRTRVEEVLHLVGLGGAAGRRAGGYSLGMRQRLALAGALLGDPRVLVLDEPTNGLDPEGVAWLRTLLREWAAQGRCVLVASHLLAEVAQAVDRVVIIKSGRVVHEGDITDLAADPGLAVRSSDPDRLAALLTASPGTTVRPDGTGRLVVRGRTAEDIGGTAARAGIAVHELAHRPAGKSLEETFLDLTGTGPTSTGPTSTGPTGTDPTTGPAAAPARPAAEVPR